MVVEVFFSATASAKETTSPPDSLKYQWCKIHELNPMSGRSAVTVKIYQDEDYGYDNDNYEAITAWVGRIPNNSAGSFDLTQWVFSDSSGFWYGGSATPVTANVIPLIEVLCDTPDIIHSPQIPIDGSQLPAYAASIGDYDNRLCGVAGEQEIITGLTHQSDNPEYCSTLILRSGNYYKSDESEPSNYMMVARQRARKQPVVDQCVAKVAVDIKAPDTPLPYKGPYTTLPYISGIGQQAGFARLTSKYPRDIISYCQSFSARNGRMLGGVEYPEIKFLYTEQSEEDAFMEGWINSQLPKPLHRFPSENQAAYERILVAGCQIFNPDNNSLIPDSIPFASSDVLYQRVDISTQHGWQSAIHYSHKHQAGCLTQQGVVKSYNYCRFTDPANDSHQIYGVLIEGEDRCGSKAPVLTGSNLEYQTFYSEQFEIYTLEKSVDHSGSNSIHTSLQQTISLITLTALLVLGSLL